MLRAELDQLFGAPLELRDLLGEPARALVVLRLATFFLVAKLDELLRDVIEPRLHPRLEIVEIRRLADLLVQMNDFGLHRALEAERVVTPALRGAGPPVRPLLELGKLLGDLLQKILELAALRLERRHDPADRVGDAAQERLPAAFGDTDLEPPSERRRGLGQRRHLGEAAHQRPQQTHDLVGHGAGHRDDENGGIRRRALGLDRSLGFQGPHQARDARVEVECGGVRA